MAAAVLWLVNSFAVRREIALATGPASEEQRLYFIDAADRPDMEAFFKALTRNQKLKMAANIGRYDAPEGAALAAKLLTAFDPAVRAELARSLSAIATKQPEAASKELKHGGNFQRLAVFEALKSAGPSAIPHVAARLQEDETRVNATSFLVEVGEPAVEQLLEVLAGDHAAARLAAADALGKIRSRKAVPALVQLYEGGLEEEKVNYVAALAGIGDPSTEELLAAALLDESRPPQIRAQAALGLGRIASPRAVRLLWPLTSHDDLEFRQAATSGLQLAGDAALRGAPEVGPETLQVARGIRSPLSDSIIRDALNGRWPSEAALAAEGRPQLVGALSTELAGLGSSNVDGHNTVTAETADALIRALLSTDEGRVKLREMRSIPSLAGLIERRLHLASG